MAGVRQLPVVFVLENNQFAYSTPNDARVRGRPRRARGGLRLPGREGGRQRRRGGVRGGRRGVRARPRGRRADADRGRDDAHARPRRARRHELRAGRDARAVGARATRSSATSSGCARTASTSRRSAPRWPRSSTARPSGRWPADARSRRRATDGVFATEDPVLGDGQAPWSRYASGGPPCLSSPIWRRSPTACARRCATTSRCSAWARTSARSAARSRSPTASSRSSAPTACGTRRWPRSAIVGTAVGAALEGLRPVCEMQFADFIACGFDQLVNVAAKMHYRQGLGRADGRAPALGRRLLRRPVPLAEPRGVVPAGARTEGRGAVDGARTRRGCSPAAIRDPNPVVYMEHKHLYRRVKGEVPEGRYETPLGRGATSRARAPT